MKGSSWKAVLVLFFITSAIESMSMSHVFAFLPAYLESMHSSHIQIWVGILNAVPFIVGLPLVPMWGVWAARFGGKTVVIRSAFVEAVVFTVFGLSHSLPQLFCGVLLVGFQLGNTGIMLASIRRLTPNRHLGFAISTFSVSSPIGMACGPLLAGLLVDMTSFTLHSVFFTDAIASFLSGVMLLVFYREEREPSVSEVQVSAWKSAWSSVRFTFTLKVTWILFGIYTLLMIARQMVMPYIPIAISRMISQSNHLDLWIGGLMGLTAMVGALVTIAAGRAGDRIGFSTVLTVGFILSGVSTLLLGITHRVVPFGVCLALYSAATSIGVAMIFALLSVRIPQTHRTTALNLVYLPLYVGGVIGPLLSSGLSSFGLRPVFIGGSVVFGLALFVIWKSASIKTAPIHEQGIPS